MTYDPTRVTDTTARDVKTGTYLHRSGHPTVNIGRKVWVNKAVRLDLVTPPKNNTAGKPNSSLKYTMKQVTYAPDDVLRVSKLP